LNASLAFPSPWDLQATCADVILPAKLIMAVNWSQSSFHIIVNFASLQSTREINSSIESEVGQQYLKPLANALIRPLNIIDCFCNNNVLDAFDCSILI
jgi:hypothetical protein